MKRRINKAAIILSVVFAFSVLYGCAEKTENVSADQTESVATDQTMKETVEDNATIDQTPEEPSDTADSGAGNDGGYSVYADKMNELKSVGLADQFTLAYINDIGSDTPELIASDSKGSFDHENAFIFTVSNGEVVEVASVIAGVDGANLDYAIGANVIHISGAAAGMRDVFSRIENGKLEELFVAEATSMDDDAKCSINGETVSEDEYYKQINDFMRPYNPLVRIAYDGLYEVTYTYKDGYGGFEQGSSENYSR